MNLRPEEISSVIKEEIKKYSTEFEVANVGTVIQVADGIARIHGLEKAMQGEIMLVRFYLVIRQTLTKVTWLRRQDVWQQCRLATQC